MRIFLSAVLVAARPSGNEASTGAVCFLSNNNANTSCPGRSHFELPWPFCSGDKRDTSSKFVMKKPGGDNAGREEEIRKKITQLKKQGKLKPDRSSSPSSATQSSASDSPLLDKLRNARAQMNLDSSVVDRYADKLGEKLGGRKGRALGFNLGSVSKTASERGNGREPKLGSLDLQNYEDSEEDDYEEDVYLSEEQLQRQLETGTRAASDAIDMLRRNVDESEDEEEMDEDEMLDAVSRALSETNFKSSRERYLEQEDSMKARSTSMSVSAASSSSTTTTTSSSIGSSPPKTTSGVGGSWSPPPPEAVNTYKPSKSGTWGAFPRPKNISVAYGGGKRVGAGVKTDEKRKQESIEHTRALLRAYRERNGIEVQSERDHAQEIEEALAIAGRAMQRGSYGVGVSALEKVTQYCSTKSKVGGKVFLELAMAYEAEGNTDQALGLYATLTKSPIEEIKTNADKLLFGLEAMNFMRNEAKIKEFSRRRVGETFIDATGFKDMASKFDKVYNTAYIDLDKGGQYYRMLTENVVRSTREARQILLKAVASGEVDRMKVIQALRSISRHFDDALTAEKKQKESKSVLVDYAGRPIIKTRRNDENDLAKSLGMDGFVLAEPMQTLENLGGEWRLQLMADRKGDGVDFFNTTLIWQVIDTADMVYKTQSQGFRLSTQSGGLTFDESDRILTREGAKAYSGGGGGNLLAMFGGNKKETAGTMTNTPQQILSVDSTLLVTRAIVTVSAADNVKDYFSVWRRAEPGTYARNQ
ncbi:hypothetical protein ACHAW6_008868 [Cyclotella cf. meneghiniana]